MKVGTKSVIGGAHCFLLHPFFVAWGWARLFGFPRDVRLWFAFALHDIGYVVCGDHGRSKWRTACPTWSAHHGLANSDRHGRTSACGTLDIGAAGWGFRSAGYAWRTSWLSRSLLHGCICGCRDGRVSCKSTWCARGSSRLETTGSRSRRGGWCAPRFPKIGCAGFKATLCDGSSGIGISGRLSEA